MTETEVDFSHIFDNIPESPEPVEATIKGEVPKWVRGTLLRNGPGIFEIGPDKYEHLFDGLALMQRFFMENGKVYYSTKYLRSDTFRQNMAAQRIVVSEFGTLAHLDPCKGIFSRYFTHYFPLAGAFTDNDLVNFIQCGDEVYASSETTILNRIDPKSLDTLERVDMQRYISVNTATAHPHYDKDGNVYNLGNGMKSYKVIRSPKSVSGSTDSCAAMRKVQVIADIPAASMKLSYYHSFGMTERFIVFPEMPLVLNPLKLMASPVLNKPFSMAMEWYGDRKTVIHLVDVETKTRVGIKYTADAFFTFHHINAYEQDGFVVMDICASKDGSLVQTATLDSMRSGRFINGDNAGSKAERYVLPLEIPTTAKAGDDLVANQKFLNTKATAILQSDGSVHCTSDVLCDRLFEFPRLNYDRCNGRMYQYFYGSELPSDKKGFVGEKLIKVDVINRSVLEWCRDDPYQFAGEPVYLKNPAEIEEDDGVVVSPVTNIKPGGLDFLLFLDAKSFKEIARAYVNPKIPISFHAHYIPQ